jgi:hypothetical protein
MLRILNTDKSNSEKKAMSKEWNNRNNLQGPGASLQNSSDRFIPVKTGFEVKSIGFQNKL